MAKCPTCYGTGEIGTTDWLTKNMTKKQIAEEKAQAIAEHEQYIKTEYAREIFEEIERHIYFNFRISKEESAFGEYSTDYLKGRIDMGNDLKRLIDELKKKYTEH